MSRVDVLYLNFIRNPAGSLASVPVVATARAVATGGPRYYSYHSTSCRRASCRRVRMRRSFTQKPSEMAKMADIFCQNHRFVYPGHGFVHRISLFGVLKIGFLGYNPFRAPNPPPTQMPSNSVRKNGFPVVQALRRYDAELPKQSPSKGKW